jgi:hypothetical protein
MYVYMYALFTHKVLLTGNPVPFTNKTDDHDITTYKFIYLTSNLTKVEIYNI